jgi:hypothetical protein
MPQTITWRKQRIRIHPRNPEKLEASSDGGASWGLRYGGGCGRFRDMDTVGEQIIANTDKGLFRSLNGGRNWTEK